MTTPAAALLRSALALIEQPECWCQGELWRDAKGRTVPASRPELAVKRCGEGACYSASLPCGKDSKLEQAMDVLRSVVGFVPFYKWQDAPERTHAEVVAAFRRAIAIAEGASP